MAIPSNCIQATCDSMIQVSDCGQKLTFINIDNNWFSKIRVDGCVITEGRRSDFVVEKGTRGIVIELKKGSVENGADQVLETARRWKIEDRCVEICGIIVGRSYPRASAGLMVKQRIFQKEHNRPLHVIKGSLSVNFDNMFRFTKFLAP